ncbi:MAG: hypothetical protein AAFQ57_12900 [Cyanobacteria bacterium J06626_14]
MAPQLEHKRRSSLSISSPWFGTTLGRSSHGVAFINSVCNGFTTRAIAQRDFQTIEQPLY